MDKYWHSSHAIYLAGYHIVWCPKFRYKVLTPERQKRLKEILEDICSRYGYKIEAVEVMSDHVHLFIHAPATVAPSDIVRTLKSISAVEMFRAFPELKRFYQRCGALWERGYFLSTTGQISEKTVKKYIENQKKKEER